MHAAGQFFDREPVELRGEVCSFSKYPFDAHFSERNFHAEGFQ